MHIYGFDKTSLLNYPEHVAATVFTGGCNMRCPFCHNGELVISPPPELLISEEEVFTHLQKRKNVLTGLCITGGEPTLQPDLKLFMEKVKALGYEIKLDTNGLKPDILGDLLTAGLIDHVAMDIKAGRDNYRRVAGLDDDHFAGGHSDDDIISTLGRSVILLLDSKIGFELRTTVVKGLHTIKDFEDIRDWMSEILTYTGGGKKIDHYYLQSYVCRDTVLDKNSDFQSFDKEELTAFAEILKPIAQTVSLRGIE